MWRRHPTAGLGAERPSAGKRKIQKLDLHSFVARTRTNLALAGDTVRDTVSLLHLAQHDSMLTPLDRT